MRLHAHTHVSTDNLFLNFHLSTDREFALISCPCFGVSGRLGLTLQIRPNLPPPELGPTLSKSPLPQRPGVRLL